jgi:hypothetical protein
MAEYENPWEHAPCGCTFDGWFIYSNHCTERQANPTRATPPGRKFLELVLVDEVHREGVRAAMVARGVPDHAAEVRAALAERFA